MVVLIIYSISINLILLQFANMGIGISCENLQQSYNTSYNETDFDSSELKQSSASIVDLALGRCQGLPYWLVLVFELPIIVGLLYIIRGFFGVTWNEQEIYV